MAKIERVIRGKNPVDAMKHLTDEERERVIRYIGPLHSRELFERWDQWAHDGQDPDGADCDWRVWMIMAGRGYGKTRAGAEWVNKQARENERARIALVGATIEDVRKVMVEGESGLLRVAHTGDHLDWHAGRGELFFGNGAIAHVYSAECYEKLRGPEHSHAWCDEVGKWNHAEDTWNNMILGMRLGERPRVLVTTTPRSGKLLPRLKQEVGVVVCQRKTEQNRNLTRDFVETVKALYEGTRWGRQELDGELIEDIEGAFWTRELIERCRVEKGTVPLGTVPNNQQRSEGQSPCGDSPLAHSGTFSVTELKRTVIGVDPPASATGDACGIVVVGLGTDGRAYVLADHSVEHATPERWARAVASAAEVWDADKIVVEANNGGDMVISTLRAADVEMPVKKVHASKGKAARAEPVSMLYEADKVFHAGTFPELEDQLCGLTSGGGYEGPGRSPDRADALVWALTELMLGKAAKIPRASVL